MFRLTALLIFLFSLSTLAGPRVGQVVSVNLKKLRPTQFSLGWDEVEKRSEKIESMSQPERLRYIREKDLTVVIGPDQTLWLIDGHHLAAALLEIDIDEAPVRIVQDWSALTPAEFFRKMKAAQYLWLYDGEGKGPLSPSELPEKIKHLEDDPFRSLVWEVRKDLEFPKGNQPFFEFRLAMMLRKHIDPKDLKKHPNWSYKKAVELIENARNNGTYGFTRSRCARYFGG